MSPHIGVLSLLHSTRSCVSLWERGGGLWSLHIKIAPLTSGSSIPWDGQEHWLLPDTQLSLVAPRPFLSHTLVAASAGRRNFVRGWSIFSYPFKDLETWRGNTCHKAFLLYHLSLNHEGCWGTTDDFITNFLHFSVFSTALWDFVNSTPVHSLMLSSTSSSVCLSSSPFIVPCKMVLARPDEWKTCPYHSSLRLLMNNA